MTGRTQLLLLLMAACLCTITAGCTTTADCSDGKWCIPVSDTIVNDAGTADDNGGNVKNEDCSANGDCECVKCEATTGWSTTNADNVVAVFPSSSMSWFSSSRSSTYSYDAFTAAVQMFPKFCDTKGDACRKMLAMFFAHACQESGCLQYVEELASGRLSNYGDYYGRGVFQLTWPKNYRKFSEDVFGNGRCLLGEKKAEIGTNGTLAWAVGIWFALNNPSTEYTNMKTLVDLASTNFVDSGGIGTYRNGFALTNLAINGDLECGLCPRESAKDHPAGRIAYFKTFCDKFGLSTWQWCSDIGKTSDTEKYGADCNYMAKNFAGNALNAKKGVTCEYTVGGVTHTAAEHYTS